MPWHPLPKPTEIAEARLLEGILASRFPSNSTLPAERELCGQLGVTRPTLREALQRLARDGWVDIQHGKPTRVRDYWHEGSLAVLATLARTPAEQPADFFDHLLEIRTLLAPAYARQAVERAPAAVADLLAGYGHWGEEPAAWAAADWELHSRLARWAANPIFPLLLNGFTGLAAAMGVRYFTWPEGREQSRRYYIALRRLAAGPAAGRGDRAEALTRRVMLASRTMWQKHALGGKR